MEIFSFGLLILIISFIYLYPFRHLPFKKTIKVILYALLPIIFLFVSGLYLAEVKHNLSCFMLTSTIILIIYLVSYLPYARYLEKLLKIKNINYYLLCSFLYLSLLATLIIGFWQKQGIASFTSDGILYAILFMMIFMVILLILLILLFSLLLKKQRLVSVSFLKVLNSQEEAIYNILKTNCNFIHVDIADGVFAHPKTLRCDDILSNTTKKLDVHLMCAHPLKNITIYRKLNTEFITIPVEIDENISKLIKIIKGYKIKVGLALNPETKVEKVLPYLKDIDQVLVLSVHPGMGGQEFMKEVIPKIKRLNTIRCQNQYHYLISVDGGVNDKTIKYLQDTGCDMVVSGSYICLSNNYQERINKLR